MSAGLIIGLIVVGTFVVIVVSSVIGARRGTVQIGSADDSLIERGRGAAPDPHGASGTPIG